MKKILSAFLAALMLLTFLPLASTPALADLPDVEFTLTTSATSIYVGETIFWDVSDIIHGSFGQKYEYTIYKDGAMIAYYPPSHGNDAADRHFTPPSPGKYKAVVRVIPVNPDQTGTRTSDEVTVTARPVSISKVETEGPVSLKVSWDQVPYATEYELWRSDNQNTGWKKIKTLAGTSLTDASLLPGTQYFYKLRYLIPHADLDGYLSEFSPVADGATASVLIGKTRITGITSPARRQVKLTWSRAPGASGYQVALSTSPNGAYKTVRILPGTTATFYGVNPGSLFFKVRPYKRISKTPFWGQYSMMRSIRVK
ncbi:MAG: fibronectin type III domain-containing protein [Bacillota bacterium]|nr:fibronectin type III domain-containing protein [Bacillota bacterium]